jgi:hypothetical protein
VANEATLKDVIALDDGVTGDRVERDAQRPLNWLRRQSLSSRTQRETGGGERGCGGRAGDRQPSGAEVRRCGRDHRCGVYGIDRGQGDHGPRGGPPSDEQALQQLAGTEDARGVDDSSIGGVPRQRPKQWAGAKQQGHARASLGKCEPE